MSQQAVSLFAGIGALSLAAHWLAWRLRLPAIVFLLAAGIVAGPLTGWLNPDALFGELLFPIVSLAVAIILFEGGLSLHLHEVRGLEAPVRRLLTLGVIVTWASTTALAWFFVDLSLPLAVLFGAMTVVTGPTVIGPLLRSVRPSQKVARVLRWEGIVIDPIGALIAVLVFEFVLSTGGQVSLGASLLTFGLLLMVGLLIGALAGWVTGEVLRRFWLPGYLHILATLVAAIGVFYLANQIHAESGLLAVTVMGIWLANMQGVPLDDILPFKENLSLMLISGLFVLLAARLNPAAIPALGWGVVGLLFGMQLLGRPLAVLASTWGTSLSWPERGLLAWIAPRGIVAAAVSALFALRLDEAGHAGAEALVPLTFLVILFTVILQSATAKPLAALLGVREPPPRGVLIVGANLVARAIGDALQRLNIPVLLTDPNWDQIAEARLQGLPAYYGNPTSEHAELNLELTGLGLLFALSPRADLNTLTSLEFGKVFGRNKVYRLPPGERDPRLPAEIRRRHRRDQTLFGTQITYAKLASLLGQGAEIRITTLTAMFAWEDYLKEHRGQVTPLFAVNPQGNILPFDGSDQPRPHADWKVVGLVGSSESADQDAD
ncbi:MULTISPECIES: cation:proton antiporter [Thiorhodovibrio]|uniref:cation:proton antiporter n=1 Tax=Thiorhodovibrio TaxID=61593 RepID=UPI001913DD67|nr:MULTISPECIES: sodium:proton antiporter [Thiorhodovibrio]MBK5969122.1 sodium:proton antiporter [Thiorhodovibrio winogradskyi]WPL13405.1 potassium/proton antiporter [Thiorhodovibrio litoralis]